jgi:hypothetical protein
MKDKIEHKFKELLENQEFPYDSKAWDVMKGSLDAKMPASKPTNWNKWFLGGAAITVIAVSTYFVIQNTEPNQSKVAQNSKELKSNSERKVDSKKSQLKSPQQVTKLNEFSNQIESETETFQSNQNENSSFVDQKSNSNNKVNNEQKTNVHDINHSIDNVDDNKVADGLASMNEINPSNSADIQDVSAISVRDLCLGESQTIENKNSFDIHIVQQANKKVVALIKSKQSYIFQAQESGSYEIISKSQGNELNTTIFEVKKVINPEISLESDLLYVKGVPTIKASSENGANSVWKVNGRTVSQNQGEIEFNPYYAGKYTVSLLSNENGCIATSEESVQVSEDYNLLAPNAFNPNSFDIKNQTFMPYALTQRDVKFTMIILDPKDGGLLYETDDASQPWTGIDKRNGQMTPSNQVYIWKVKLENALPGEPNEYKGTITKL